MLRKLSARYPTDLPAWKKLSDHFRSEMQQNILSSLFSKSKNRKDVFSLEAGDLILDYSKNHLKRATIKLLCQLARQANVSEAKEAMFTGEKINHTEDRSVLHVALRAKIADSIAHNTSDIMEVWEVLTKMESFVNKVHEGVIVGSTGKHFKNIVNIGIGGSDLGPVMASKALRPYWKEGIDFYSVSNVDGTQLYDLKKNLDVEATLFVICSKTFTTQETMSNAFKARSWVVNSLGEAAIHHHFVAVSTNESEMSSFGIQENYRFGFWEWVGGRYSIWSSVGLSLALTIGMDSFKKMCSGGRRMDQHFYREPIEKNMPILLALIGIWYNNFFGFESHAILPYTNRLDRFPAYLQQLQMESSGKNTRMDGKPVRCNTGVIIWGESGNNAQHSFMQLLHQGTRFVPVDFILPSNCDSTTAHCLAQADALMYGTENEVMEPHRTHIGNRPSNLIHFKELTPETLGQLVALYEHKVFVEGVIWGINSFDQWGVELGKKLALKNMQQN